MATETTETEKKDGPAITGALANFFRKLDSLFGDDDTKKSIKNKLKIAGPLVAAGGQLPAFIANIVGTAVDTNWDNLVQDGVKGKAGAQLTGHAIDTGVTAVAIRLANKLIPGNAQAAGAAAKLLGGLIGDQVRGQIFKRMGIDEELAKKGKKSKKKDNKDKEAENKKSKAKGSKKKKSKESTEVEAKEEATPEVNEKSIEELEALKQKFELQVEEQNKKIAELENQLNQQNNAVVPTESQNKLNELLANTEEQEEQPAEELTDGKDKNDLDGDGISDVVENGLAAAQATNVAENKVPELGGMAKALKMSKDDGVSNMKVVFRNTEKITAMKNAGEAAKETIANKENNLSKTGDARGA